ncbi:hypothetical protein CVS40_9860 [Lucilia cuprina]|nr:hypothetical protein CVS40_9860 [Lucilia cuprina]
MVTFEDDLKNGKRRILMKVLILEKPRCFNQQQFVSVNTISQDTENGKQILKYYEKNKFFMRVIAIYLLTRFPNI